MRLWDLATGQPAGSAITAHAGGVLGLCVVSGAAPGQPVVLASAGSDGTVRLWDLASVRPGRRRLYGALRCGRRRMRGARRRAWPASGRWPAPGATAPSGSGTPAPVSQPARTSPRTPVPSLEYACYPAPRQASLRSWPAPAATARSGSGTLPPVRQPVRTSPRLASPVRSMCVVPGARAWPASGPG